MKQKLKLSILLVVMLFFCFVSQAQFISFEHDGMNREYIYYEPSELNENRPLVFVMHGFTSSANHASEVFEMKEIADQYGFAVCFPNGSLSSDGARFWNVGYAFHQNETVDDVDFLSELAQHLQATHNLNPNYTFATGFSNGGEMCFLLACQGTDTFKAVAPVAGVLFQQNFNNCDSSTPIPLLAIHGSADDINLIDGDPINAGGYGIYPSAPEVIAFFAEKNETTSIEQETSTDIDPVWDGSAVNSTKYLNGINNNEVWFYEIVDGGHTWARGSNGNFNAGQTVWSFFQNYIDNNPENPSATPPVITLNGTTAINLQIGDTYVELGATATDNIDGDISSNIVIGGDTIDTNTEGAYVITYNVSDTDGNNAIQVTRTVNVTSSNVQPTDSVNITLSIVLDIYPEETTWEIQNDSNQVIFSGGPYGNEPQSSTVNFSDVLENGCYSLVFNDTFGDGICCSEGPGSFTLTNTDTGIVLASGGEFQFSITNNFCIGDDVAPPIDTISPTITLNGADTINLNLGDTYEELGATANDNVDGNISSNIIIGGDIINTNSEGPYVITYNVSDTAGNAATQITRTVNVTAEPISNEDSTNITLSITLDNYPDETSWEIINNSNDAIIFSGGTYDFSLQGSTVIFSDVLENGCYSLVFNDSFGDGICCFEGDGSYVLTNIDTGAVLASGGEFQSTTINNFCVGDNNTLKFDDMKLEENVNFDFSFYPNPVNNTLFIRANKNSNYSIIDGIGRLIQTGVVKREINVETLNSGMYFLSVNEGENKLTKRFIKD